MASPAMELQLGGVRIFANHAGGNKRKQNVFTIFVRRRALVTRVYLYTQTAVHTHVTKHSYFDRGKNPNTLNFCPMPG